MAHILYKTVSEFVFSKRIRAHCENFESICVPIQISSFGKLCLLDIFLLIQ